MSACERVGKCPFFNDKMASKPATADMMKKSYCMADKEHCARYIVASSGKDCPPDLFPNMQDRAKQLCA